MKMMLAQTAPARFDVKANLATLEMLCRQAIASKVELLVLPELALTGYNIFDRLATFAEPLDGPLCQAVADFARRFGIYIAFGMAERDSQGTLYNTAVMLDDRGTQLGAYRKRQLWDREHEHFRPGDEYCVLDTRLGRIGLMICYDNEFPEISRTLTGQGAQLIVSPTANMHPNASRQRLQIRARAMDNQCFVACANRAGQEDALHYCGNSIIAGPDGEVLGQLGEASGTLIAELDFSAIDTSRQAQDYLKDLRS
ncbi:carbon-nitrogen hydrolase family protein [Halomonas sp. M20]|uniref:carbon-nitrogen hydrolase family protein n=1 Tax=Halomonas sp. M20 TaxID=2763264 RepID=UPI001D0A1EFC|nr:carbon-nitrogen hydrolase family protein [Halomonas sp. M20]